jgi:hypothetical protein
LLAILVDGVCLHARVVVHVGSAVQRICVRALVRALLTGRRAKFQVVSLQFDLLDEERVRALQKKVFTTGLPALSPQQPRIVGPAARECLHRRCSTTRRCARRTRLRRSSSRRSARPAGSAGVCRRNEPCPTQRWCVASSVPLVARCAVGGTLVTSRAVLSRVLEGLSCVSMRCLRLRPAGIHSRSGAPGCCHTS